LLSLDLLPDGPSQSSVTSGIQAHSAVAALDPYLRELLRFLNRQTAEPNGVEQLKDGRIRADSQRQRHDGHQRESGTQTEVARAVAQILPETIEPIAVHAAIILRLGLQHVLEEGDGALVPRLPQ